MSSVEHLIEKATGKTKQERRALSERSTRTVDEFLATHGDSYTVQQLMNGLGNGESIPSVIAEVLFARQGEGKIKIIS